MNSKCATFILNFELNKLFCLFRISIFSRCIFQSELKIQITCFLVASISFLIPEGLLLCDVLGRARFNDFGIIFGSISYSNLLR